MHDGLAGDLGKFSLGCCTLLEGAIDHSAVRASSIKSHRSCTEIRTNNRLRGTSG